MTASSAFYRSLIFSYVTLLTSQVISQEFSRCYSDVNICLWTNGSSLRQSSAETACRQRNNSFLARISDRGIQDKLRVFRNDAQSLLGTSGFWVGIDAVSVNSFHWLDGSPLAAGGEVLGQAVHWKRFAAIEYDNNNKKFVFYARQWSYSVSSHICQLQQGASCGAGDLSMNSKCYKKFNRQLSWFSASNECLSHGGSLAIFTDIGRPSQNSNLTAWLDTNKRYWIGLVRSWWKTTDEDGRSVDVQYSNWESGHPFHQLTYSCVIVTQPNQWQSFDCNHQQRYVCQSYGSRTTTTTTTTTTTPLSSRTPPTKPKVPTPPSSVTRMSSMSSASGDVSVSPASTTTTTNTSSGGGDKSQKIAIGVGVTLAVLIIIAVVVIILLLLYKRRKTEGDKNANGFATTDHGELEPIDAYQPPGDQHVTYATIVPAKSFADHQPQQPVIYAELASTQPPVVNTDDNA